MSQCSNLTIRVRSIVCYIDSILSRRSSDKSAYSIFDDLLNFGFCIFAILANRFIRRVENNRIIPFIDWYRHDFNRYSCWFLFIVADRSLISTNEFVVDDQIESVHVLSQSIWKNHLCEWSQNNHYSPPFD